MDIHNACVLYKGRMNLIQVSALLNHTTNHSLVNFEIFLNNIHKETTEMPQLHCTFSTKEKTEGQQQSFACFNPFTSNVCYVWKKACRDLQFAWVRYCNPSQWPSCLSLFNPVDTADARTDISNQSAFSTALPMHGMCSLTHLIYYSCEVLQMWCGWR